MPVRVLVVDDSNFFQHRLKEIINEHPDLKVIGIASNGREAVDKAAELKPDIITMDFEMPVMDGVTAIRHIMAHRKVPILMFSSLTYEGAKVTLDALAAGALDFIPKDFAEVSRNSAALKQKLHERLLTLAGSSVRLPSTDYTTDTKAPVMAPTPSATSAATSALARSTSISSAGSGYSHHSSVSAKPGVNDSYRLKRQPKILVIGASTGGPVALGEVLTTLPANFPLPIVLVQHMPENFTKAFAERLNKQCHIRVREAIEGDLLEPGLALLAPGGKQLMLDKRNNGCVRILADDDRINYKPSLDITFGSAANAFGDKVLGVVLTGMGSDGCQGARLLKESGSAIWSQDEASCVIYGMPMAVAKAGLTDKVLSLKEIGPRLVREVM
ncbi:protein-glutamate methylesterase/protein-glutamine glutaminase [Cellvibrio japonicus]|uniref:Protein-glutamate methylesterase/protein-glutamine glutaminase n=1 Tax=Cellvibrio japonicus (strain Ueda107) TaxID=498211 RepID=B3PIJ7_CELJU|nr:chemotaxis response regulator protein-glutamate methylesterase [Cellvibrio japonicus]ACE85514.1 protein-glutamate methylesterase CheB [Cellvibrio japonicus Ueda107]QEI12593.1 chemotaxis response regulator protein-glutamate methylesterase [Cellvibrio japonicus]QEI16167.1 chemotaxis response regulator protein-glutamate methylesterase [Cellvibrio japonicus]QEI19745.1 chemotaxis response regulator protein-glutamate methylesterase [Cellvibrio japonicus]